ncbi:MAG: DapH/DapD/GlmU-related protein [Methanothrix sp.]
MLQYAFMLIIRLIRFIRLKVLIWSGLKIGKNCFVSHSALIDPSFLHIIEIGDNVTITANVKILAHDSSTKIHLGYTRIGKVEICNNVFIGIDSVILPNVRIGSNSIIGAGSVVTGNVPENTVVAGSPAKIICSLESFLNKHRDRIEHSICFDKNFTVEGKISSVMKDEMNELLKDSCGYII